MGFYRKNFYEFLKCQQIQDNNAIKTETFPSMNFNRPLRWRCLALARMHWMLMLTLCLMALQRHQLYHLFPPLMHLVPTNRSPRNVLNGILPRPQAVCRWFPEAMRYRDFRSIVGGTKGRNNKKCQRLIDFIVNSWLKCWDDFYLWQ